ncbi:MAG: hypothetical protein V3S20_08755, partial [Dehalococcoidia bacterium]
MPPIFVRPYRLRPPFVDREEREEATQRRALDKDLRRLQKELLTRPSPPAGPQQGPIQRRPSHVDLPDLREPRERSLEAIAEGFAPERPGPERPEDTRQRINIGAGRAREFAGQAEGQEGQIVALRQALDEEGVTPVEFDRAVRGFADPDRANTPIALIKKVRKVLDRFAGSLERVRATGPISTLPAPPEGMERGGTLLGGPEFVPKVPGITDVARGTAQAALRADRAIKEFAEPVTKPIGEALVQGSPAGILLRGGEAAGVPGAEATLEKATDIGGEAAAEILNPVNLIPIPIIDPLVARSLGLVFRGGKFVLAAGRAATRGEIRVFARESAELFARTGNEAYRAAKEAFEGVLGRGGAELGGAGPAAARGAPLEIPGQTRPVGELAEPGFQQAPPSQAAVPEQAAGQRVVNPQDVDRLATLFQRERRSTLDATKSQISREIGVAHSELGVTFDSPGPAAVRDASLAGRNITPREQALAELGDPDTISRLRDLPRIGGGAGGEAIPQPLSPERFGEPEQVLPGRGGRFEGFEEMPEVEVVQGIADLGVDDALLRGADDVADGLNRLAH